MLALLAFDDVDLPASRGQRAGVFAADAEQDELRRISEIETDAAAVRPPVLADFVPDDVALVFEAECGQHAQSLGQQGVGYPQIQMGRLLDDLSHRKGQYVVKRHGPVAIETLVLRGHLPRAVLELPRGIGEHRLELLASDTLEQILPGIGKTLCHFFSLQRKVTC